MDKKTAVLVMLLSFIMLVFIQCEKQDIKNDTDSLDKNLKSGSLKGRPGGETTASNNLSFPVLWAENVTKPLPGTPDVPPSLNGQWWYWWGTTGTDPNIVPLSCPPDPDDPNYCDDGIPGQVTGNPPGEGWVKAFLQKDSKNVWQAGSANCLGAPVNVDWIDWGDNLESSDWYTNSKVRTEVVLFKDLDSPKTEYEMRHLYGLGIDEVHGLAVDQSSQVMKGPGMQATVYSHCARLTIQKLLVAKDNSELANLVWTPQVGWNGVGSGGIKLVNPPIFNSAVYSGIDGPSYYSAEINVKGRVIYGYTWDVNKLNDRTVNQGTPDGYYRITFSLDNGGGLDPNTFFTRAQVLLPLEEEITIASSGGGANAVIDQGKHITYIDVKIIAKTGGRGSGR